MIRNENEYREAVDRLEQDRQVIEQQKERFGEVGLSPEEIERALEPSLCFHEQLKEEVLVYEKLKRREIEPLYNLNSIGTILVGARIALGITQRELANRLGVSESSISRDERNEYHGISTDRAQKILEEMGIKFKMEIEIPMDHAA